MFCVFCYYIQDMEIMDQTLDWTQLLSALLSRDGKVLITECRVLSAKCCVLSSYWHLH